MTDSVSQFFAAWADSDPTTRDAAIDESLGTTIFYADPRTEAPLTTADAVKSYVGQFSEMAPGMPVSAVNISTTLNFARATVHFGAGERVQTGQYIADLDDAGKITRLVGFVGMGAPE
ncbi:nuclear transport factor 2 family protein [Flavimaricola marinus]|uniref:SnoaL-like domain protein n=1 Tax=Flavimaricola marinus TaxID=1819565 RepID=A0A238L8Y8_9RHOB|nr:nuclear transport factor 2 family protein [Flavimaricola marinus]SMY06043.1 hypothetical protein LOM8899_00164 [Flavimaricola marinus]